jgi:hypothetical protein
MSIDCRGMVEGIPVSRCSTALSAWLGPGGDGTFAWLRRAGQLPLQCLAKRHEVGAQREADVAQLDHVDAAYTTLHVADEVLHHAEFRRQVLLPYAALAARCPKQFAQAFVFDAMDGFAHGRCRWERSWTLYCRIVFTNLV